jgi:orotidine-5'-phosphate decarboxylase
MKPEKIVVALDYDYPEQAYRLVEQVEEAIEWFKVGPTLFTRSGVEVINFLHRKRKKIFLDLKLHDTPQVVSTTVRQIADMGVHLTSLHCLGGKRMLEAAGTQLRGSHLKLLGVTLLTSQKLNDTKEVGWDKTDAELVLQLVSLAQECRLAGIICSPNELIEVRKKVLADFLLFTPGIRPNRETVFQEDQMRVATPEEALSWGADYLIIGRPITQAREPRAVIESLLTK